MTLDLNTANLLAMTSGNGGATAQSSTPPSGAMQSQAQVQPAGTAEASPFAMLVNASQGQTAAAPIMPGSVRGSALSSASTLPLEAAGASPAGALAANDTTDAVLAGEIVLPVTPVAPVSPIRGKSSLPVQEVIDPAMPATSGAAATPPTTGNTDPVAAATAKVLAAGKPVSETIATKPIATSPAPSQSVPPAAASGTVAPQTENPAAIQAGTTAATSLAASSAMPLATAPAATATPKAATPTTTADNAPSAKPVDAKSGTAADNTHVDVKAAPFAKAPATAVGLNAPAPGGTGNPAASATSAALTTGATPTEQVTATVNASENAPLRQRASDAPAIQTASSLAARPAGGQSQTANTGANGGQSGNSGTGGNPSAATPSPTSPAADPGAAMTASKDALPTAAQSGAPITPPAALQAGAQAQPVITPDQAAADAALQAETDFNLSRVDGRMAADRSATAQPRFTPHTTQQLAGQITKQVSNGNRVFDIRLDPAELGKVDVRIELRADNRVHAVLTVERPETLNELQRSARDLERSLAEAGLELDEDGLSFQMNDGETPAGDDGRGQGEALPIFTQTTELAQRAEDELASRPRSAYGFLLSGRSGVDVQV